MAGSRRDLTAGRRTKIICTLGPATDPPGVMEDLLSRGMDAARLNLSFGEIEEHAARIDRIRSLMGPTRRPVAVIADLPGRKVRLGALEGDEVHLRTGETVTFVRDSGQEGNAQQLPVDDAFFHDNMTREDIVLLSDGVVELSVTKIDADAIEAKVVYGGDVSERTGVHAPGMPISGGPLTDEDLPYLKMCVEKEVDYIALSHVVDQHDILTVREKLQEMGSSIALIAKIELSEAFARLDGILRRADAVMIRRGDLGAQIEVTRVPLVQKEILRLANQAGVPVIIATQMLGSMIAAPAPTRAEASDVSNAVADGADGVLLSAETAIGKYPGESAHMMARIVRETERERFERATPTQTESYPSPFADTTASMACHAAEQTRAKLIACFTESGRTARLVGKYRPTVPIIAFCSQDRTRRRLAINWGVRSDRLDIVDDVEQMVRLVEERLTSRNLVGRGDRVAIVFGAPVGELGHTNSVRLHEIG
ncbi:MAG: pyruvate kinase [Deltaproteobacteria bacterium]